MGSRCGQAGGCKAGEVDVREAEDDGITFSGPLGPGAGEAAVAEEVVPTRQARMPSEVEEQGGNATSSEEEEEEEDDDEEDDASSTDQVWSAIVEIDRGFPFDFVWPGLKVSIFRALRMVSNTWPAMGWQNEGDLEHSLRRAVETDGAGAIARGLDRSQAERIAEHLRGELPCSVRLDREGAAAAATIAPAVPSQDDGPRRERLRRRLRELRERAIHDEVPLAGMGLLHHIERDLEDDERWRSRAVAMAHALDRLQTLGPDFMDPFSRALSLASVGGRKITISVNRDELLTSAMGPVLSAAPHDLCPGRLCVKYLGEEGEDGDGGGGVTRAFLTHAGELIARPQLGLLLPSSEGSHLQLCPLPGFLAPGGQGAEGVWQQPERWCRFFGRLLGMAMVHECPLGLMLAPSFCRQLLDQEPCFEDLRFAPGLSCGGSGWYNTLRVLLAHRAPDILKEDPTLPKLDDVELDKALFGLDAVMPSRAQQVFEALADYLSRAAHSPQQWVGAADIAASLLAEAKTSTQRKLAMCKAKELVDGVLAGGRELPPDMPRALQALRVAIQAAGALQAAGKEAGDVASPEDQQRAAAEAEEEPKRWAEGPLAQIQSWRVYMARGPRRVLGAWRDAAQKCKSPGAAAASPPSERPEGCSSGESAAEAQQRPQPSLERSLSSVQGLGFSGGDALSSANLHAFAKAVSAKALAENLKPHLDLVVEEFRRIVSLRMRGGLTWQQLQARISGQRLDPVSFVQAWRDKTTYQACTEEHESVRLWWSYASQHSPEELLRLFAWCTGFAAIPATAWKFRINIVDDVRRCPTVNTCMTDDTSAANRGVKMPTLYLPAYNSKATLAKKMDWAIAGASGIHLH